MHVGQAGWLHLSGVGLDAFSEGQGGGGGTPLPLEEHGFTLHKGAFCDGLALAGPLQYASNCAYGSKLTKHSTNAWPPCLLPNGTSPTVKP